MNKYTYIKTGISKKPILNNFSEPGLVLALLTIVVGMLIWNWQLLLSLVIGITVMILSYSLQKGNWQLRWFKIRQFLASFNSRLPLAVITGGFTTIITYMIVYIWVESDSPWLASATIIQGIVTLLTLLLLLWQIFNVKLNDEEDSIDNLLEQLTEYEALKRLMALRKLNKYLIREDVDMDIKEEMSKCLQLLLKQEKETIVRDAVLDCLENIDEFKVIRSKSQEVLIPISFQRKKVVVD